MGEYGPLSTVVVRALLDKGYDKRRNAGFEIERTVRDFVQKDELVPIKNIISVLSDFVISPNPHYRKGGLIGLASVSLGLGTKVIDPFIKDLISPIFPCFNDQNPNVRYYATEALCNICRVARSAILILFTDIFSIIIQLSFEVDQNMRNATELLDKALKDIVTESASFDLVSFIPVLREKCLLKQPPAQTQMMLISWVSSLQSVPDVDLIPFLPQILDGIFLVLESPKTEVKKMTEIVIGQFMANMERKSENVKYVEMVNILIVHAQSQDPLVERTALRMIFLFITLAGRGMLPYCSGILRAGIPCFAYVDAERLETKSLVEDINNCLMALITCDDDDIPASGSAPIFDSHLEDKIDVESIMEVLQSQLMTKQVACKTAVLRWMHLLNEKTPVLMQNYVDEMLHSLLRTICDPSDEVVLLALQVLAQIASANFCKPESSALGSSSPPSKQKSLQEKEGERERLIVGKFFLQFLKSLLHLFDFERSILKTRGSFIVRQLCVMLPAVDIYCTFAELLMKEKNLPFATVMVEMLSLILLTTKELFSLRKVLRSLETEQGCDLFVKLFGCWCHSPVATLTLCLLSQCYEQAATVVHLLGDLDVTTDTLVELDKLIQMIESPIFSSLRLQLLYPAENKALIEALYGILMLIPQTDAFQMLRCRLNCVPPPSFLSERGTQSPSPSSPTKGKKKFHRDIDFADLMSHFVATQQRHQIFRERSVKERLQSTAFTTNVRS